MPRINDLAEKLQGYKIEPILKYIPDKSQKTPAQNQDLLPDPRLIAISVVRTKTPKHNEILKKLPRYNVFTFWMYYADSTGFNLARDNGHIYRISLDEFKKDGEKFKCIPFSPKEEDNIILILDEKDQSLLEEIANEFLDINNIPPNNVYICTPVKVKPNSYEKILSKT